MPAHMPFIRGTRYYFIMHNTKGILVGSPYFASLWLNYYCNTFHFFLLLFKIEYHLLTFQVNSLGDRPFNLKGGLWFFASFKMFFSDNTRARIFFLIAQSAKFFFLDCNIRLYDKQSDLIFSLHQNQNIVFSNIGNQNICLR